MSETPIDGIATDTRSNTVEPKSLVDISSKYNVLHRLGSGYNDSAYLVENNEGKKFVAITPLINIDLWWGKTKNKANKVDILDQLGIGEFGVHVIDEGLLLFEQGQLQDPSIIIEYGGRPIEMVKNDADKLKVLDQVWLVTKTLNNAGYAIHDFKFEHWLYQKAEEGDIRVKLIDYTQIWKLPQVSLKTGDNDHRRGDLRSFAGLVEFYFPWFKSEVSYYGKYQEMKETIDKDLERLVEENTKLSTREKYRRKLINRVSQKIRSWRK